MLCLLYGFPTTSESGQAEARYPAFFLCGSKHYLYSSEFGYTTVILLNHMQQNIQFERIHWIDWMKFIGIYFIVYGHFFSYGNVYVYVFNVPLFFIVSGFLSKKEKGTLLFWKKLWYNLIVPMFIISFFVFLYDYRSYFIINSTSDLIYLFRLIKWYIFNACIGMHNVLLTCWFIYTLIVIKIIYQYCGSNKTNIIFSILFLICTYLFNKYQLRSYLYSASSIVNVFTAYPYFIVGIYLRSYKDVINNFNNKIHLLLLFSFSIVLLCGKFNEPVWMYICGYGSNIIYFLVGGISGTAAVFSISKLLGSCPKYVITISTGTILILGFHWNIIGVMRLFFADPSLWDFIFAAIIVCAFIPLINFFEYYFPFIIGKLRIK